MSKEMLCCGQLGLSLLGNLERVCGTCPRIIALSGEKARYLSTYFHCLLFESYSTGIILSLQVSFSMEFEKIAAKWI